MVSLNIQKHTSLSYYVYSSSVKPTSFILLITRLITNTIVHNSIYRSIKIGFKRLRKLVTCYLIYYHTIAKSSSTKQTVNLILNSYRYAIDYVSFNIKLGQRSWYSYINNYSISTTCILIIIISIRIGVAQPIEYPFAYLSQLGTLLYFSYFYLYT
jgi:hypothetical protein